MIDCSAAIQTHTFVANTMTAFLNFYDGVLLSEKENKIVVEAETHQDYQQIITLLSEGLKYLTHILTEFGKNPFSEVVQSQQELDQYCLLLAQNCANICISLGIDIPKEILELHPNGSIKG